jgi:predicted RNA-binding Zn-ribbon protein involved in translation (DUF1610 family)
MPHPNPSTFPLELIESAIRAFEAQHLSGPYWIKGKDGMAWASRCPACRGAVVLKTKSGGFACPHCGIERKPKREKRRH